MHLYKRKRKHVIRWAAVLGIFFCAVVFLHVGSSRMEKTARSEQQELLTDVINQAVVNCYAMEGRYPESMQYLIENYGIQVDFDQYAVSYEIFAENIKPRVKVIRLGETENGE
ncbi:MAG: hypothetical protein HFI20_08720 [Lachnospiraceae bacterium]|nr:hypothetical protein [Lachnospiraceae bacterium]